MAHEEQKNFCKYVKSMFPAHFVNGHVLDIGSLDINGNNRYLFEDSEYIGCDLGPGDNVNVISPAHLLGFASDFFDIVISTECLEHDKHWKLTLANAFRMLAPEGLMILTMATTDRGEHGTTKNAPDDAPFTNDYYQNLTEDDLKSALDVNDFYTYEFSVKGTDLRFWGIKNE
jgi:SAM-dependent methyltransferase